MALFLCLSTWPSLLFKNMWENHASYSWSQKRSWVVCYSLSGFYNNSIIGVRHQLGLWPTPLHFLCMQHLVARLHTDAFLPIAIWLRLQKIFLVEMQHIIVTSKPWNHYLQYVFYWEVLKNWAYIGNRCHSRFFVQVEHETTYLCSYRKSSFFH